MSTLHKISGCDRASRKADVLFIHGLGGDAFTTWRYGDDNSTSWPHWVGSDFPQVGIWSLGYSASPSKWPRMLRLLGLGSRVSGQSMALPRRAYQVLDLMIQQGFGTRPILFICHSLGGLVVKEILRKASDSPETAQQQLAKQVRGVLFLGTPHTGVKLASLANAFRAIFGSTVNVEDLRAHDAHLSDLYDWYRNHSAALGIRTETYYEHLAIAGVLPVVNPSSAHPGVGKDPVCLEEDHISLAKPRQGDAPVCGAARGMLREYVLNAQTGSSRPISGRRDQVLTEASSSQVIAHALPAVHVFLPDPDGDQTDPFYQDGAVQYEGFEQGKLDAGGLCEPERVQYHSMKYTTTARDLFADMKRCYDHTSGAYYIMTMSSMIEEISNAFRAWHAECTATDKPAPVLIATVASSPGFAASSQGQLRWYVRSEEECRALAQYLRTNGASHVGIFYVTLHKGKSDSHYGNRARELFATEFCNLGGVVMAPHQVTDDEGWREVNDWCEKEIPELLKANPSASPAAFVVAYGDAMSATVAALIQKRFAGIIACTSPLTGRKWQPAATVLDDRIVTVMPKRKGAWSVSFDDDKDVVHFFTRETLRRVLQLTRDARSSADFIRRWMAGEGEIPARGRRPIEQKMENLTGDIVVQVEVVGAKEWRCERP